jgi:hypothetical protein
MRFRCSHICTRTMRGSRGSNPPCITIKISKGKHVREASVRARDFAGSHSRARAMRGSKVRILIACHLWRGPRQAGVTVAGVRYFSGVAEADEADSCVTDQGFVARPVAKSDRRFGAEVDGSRRLSGSIALCSRTCSLHS